MFEPLPSPKTQPPASPDDEKAFATRRVQQAYEETELSALKAALDRHGENLTQAASELGIGRSKAYRMPKCMPRDA